jgi:hypothetical protein
MNKHKLVLLLVLLATSCAQKQKHIISDSINISQRLGFAEKNLFVKSQLKKTFTWENNYCYTQLDLFDDSTFFKRIGCEGRIHFSLGKWKLKKDSLILSYTPLEKLNMILKYSLKENKSQFFVLKILNQNDEPIEDLEVVGFKKGIPAKTALKYGILLTDKEGEIKLKKANFDSISIYGFKNITNRILTFKNTALPDSLMLNLFFNSRNFCQRPTYEYYNDNSVLLIKNCKLISVHRKK